MADISNSEPDINASQPGVDDYGQYHVNSQLEMCSILKVLMVKPDVITAYYDETLTNFILTSVIAVDTIKRNFILDISSDQARNEIFLKSSRVICKTKCNNVRVEFSIRQIKATSYDNENAFICELPANILYLQRRDYYRMAIPLGDNVKCRMKGKNNSIISLNVSDISSGGIGINEPNIANKYELYERTFHCEMDLGEIGTITFDMELRNKKIVKLQNTKEVVRLGYKFIDLHTPDNAIIQRYVHSIDMRKKQSK